MTTKLAQSHLLLMVLRSSPSLFLLLLLTMLAIAVCSLLLSRAFSFPLSLLSLGSRGIFPAPLLLHLLVQSGAIEVPIGTERVVSAKGLHPQARSITTLGGEGGGDVH